MQLIGHRGARREAPENTLGGFRYIAAMGLRAVEFDVRLSADNQLMVIHDATLLRTAGIPADVKQQTAMQLAAADQSATWAQWTAVEPTPTLAEVLAICRQFEHIEVEVKAVDDQAAALHLCALLQDALAGFEHIVTITSFDLKVLNALNTLQSRFRRGLLVESTSVAPQGFDFVQGITLLALQLNCSRVGMFDVLMTHALLQSLRVHQLASSVWTVNSVARAQELQAWGVDGLITDVPSTMLNAGVGYLSQHDGPLLTL